MMTAKRTLVTGDLQGCADETLTLLNVCNAGPNDRVIFAGDLIDRGPDSAGCLAIARELEQRQNAPAAILGNHEARHLQYRDVEASGRVPVVNAPSHVETRRQLKDIDYAYMRSMPLYIRLPEYNAVVVHAGVFPGVPIEEQDRRHLLHIQMIDPPNPKSFWPSRVPPGGKHKFWTHFWRGPERVIFGHSVFDRPLITDHAWGIDGGCCFGRKLHALILPEWTIVSIPSRTGLTTTPLSPPDRTGTPVSAYEIHPGVNTFS